MIRSILRAAAAAVLIVIAFRNILEFNRHSIDGIARRAENIVVVQENRIARIRAKLLEAGYGRGKIALVTSSDLSGKPRTAEQDRVWYIHRYAMIPWHLVQDTHDAPYVIADFSGGEPIEEIGSDFIKVYEAGNGLVLFRRRTQ